MSDVVVRYVSLLETQLLERVSAGGALSEDREGEYVEEFDALWRSMAPTEREAIERLLATQPKAPENLDVVDVVVGVGHVPRRAA